MPTRPGNQPVPPFDLIKHNALKDASKYWLRYAGKKYKILNPDFVKDAIVSTECRTNLFPQDWITYVEKRSQNKKLTLSSEIKNKIDTFARDSCYHPTDQISHVRYGDNNTKKKVWQGKTFANNIKDLDNQ